MTVQRELRTLADAYGVQLEYTGFTGERAQADPDAVLEVLRSLGASVNTVRDVRGALEHRRAEVSGRIADPVLVAWDGRLRDFPVRLPKRMGDRIAFELFLEDGEVRKIGRAHV